VPYLWDLAPLFMMIPACLVLALYLAPAYPGLEWATNWCGNPPQTIYAADGIWEWTTITWYDDRGQTASGVMAGPGVAATHIGGLPFGTKVYLPVLDKTYNILDGGDCKEPYLSAGKCTDPKSRRIQGPWLDLWVKDKAEGKRIAELGPKLWVKIVPSQIVRAWGFEFVY